MTPFDPHTASLNLHKGTYFKPNGEISTYPIQNLLPGSLLFLLAGTSSTLLGIGAGTIKVLALDQVMKLPIKVSTTTSNFIIGVTAAAGAGAHLKLGYIQPSLSMPVMLGVLLGSFVGARSLASINNEILKQVVRAMMVLLAIKMICDGIGGLI